MHYFSNIIAIVYLILIITWEWVWQSGDKETFEGLGASVRHSTSGEQQQYTSIPKLCRFVFVDPVTQMFICMDSWQDSIALFIVYRHIARFIRHRICNRVVISLGEYHKVMSLVSYLQSA